MNELAVAGRHTKPRGNLNVLLGHVAAGDHDAFTSVYEELSGPVYGLAHKVLRNTAQAEEVAQDVMVEVWRTAARFRPERATAMAWVMTLAHRRAVDRMRSAQASATRDHRSTMRNQAPASDEVDEQVEVHLQHEQVRGQLSALTELQQKAITLAYYDGLTYHEVATRLAAPSGTIKTQLRDALIRLRD